MALKWLPLLLLLSAPVFGQTVTVPPESPVYTVVSPTVEHQLPEGANPVYFWTGTEGISFGENTADNKKPYFTGRPGPYTVTLFESWIEDGKPRQAIKSASGKFVGGGEPPDPPPPPPVVKTLAQLAGDKAPALAAMYAELLLAVREGLFDEPEEGDTSLAWFKRVETAALTRKGLAGHGAAAEIEKRLAVDSLEKLAAAIEGVVKELGAPAPPTDPTVKATAATYVYEKDDGDVPTPVVAALNRLNRERNVVATPFEDDTTDGDGDVPEQYKVPLAAAQEAGLPSLVVTAGSNVLKVVKNPTTEAAVMEAIP